MLKAAKLFRYFQMSLGIILYTVRIKYFLKTNANALSKITAKFRKAKCF